MSLRALVGRPTHRWRRTVAGVAITGVLVLVLPALSQASASISLSQRGRPLVARSFQVDLALADPQRNEPRSVGMAKACRDALSDACQDAVVAAIDSARASEHVGALLLPAYYRSLTEPAQLLVLAQEERTARGLTGFAGLSTRLDRMALTGAEATTDPSGPASATWGSNWAGGEANALLADFDWMYDDGPGSPNIDCTSTDNSGCWRHRDNILASYGPRPSMGAAAVVVRGVTSLAELFTSSPPANLDFRLPVNARPAPSTSPSRSPDVGRHASPGAALPR